MIPIDINTWHRKNHFAFYKDFSDPCFNLCCQVEVTRIVAYAKQHKLSLFLVLLYLSNKATMQIQAFKIRLDAHNNPVMVDQINPSATVLTADDSFNFCYFKNQPTLTTFIEQATLAREQALKQPALSNISQDKDQIYYSVIPWLEFTSFKHATTKGFSDIPKIVFGKITPRKVHVDQEEKLMMPVSVELHHALADGIDIAKYIQAFQDQMTKLVG